MKREKTYITRGALLWWKSPKKLLESFLTGVTRAEGSLIFLLTCIINKNIAAMRFRKGKVPFWLEICISQKRLMKIAQDNLCGASLLLYGNFDNHIYVVK